MMGMMVFLVGSSIILMPTEENDHYCYAREAHMSLYANVFFMSDQYTPVFELSAVRITMRR